MGRRCSKPIGTAKEGFSWHRTIGTRVRRTPIRTGRAIDIVLDSQRPTEKVEGEILVQAFIDLSDDMQWEYLIYAKRAWDPLKAYDQPIPRIADPRDYTTAWERARYEHITHIHIQWSEEKKISTYSRTP